MSNYDKPQFTGINQVEALQIRCDQILHEIQSRDSRIPTRLSDRDLTDEYNRLSHQLENWHSRPSVDPLVVLPPEIWIDILQETANDNRMNVSSTEALLLFTSVSTHWNKLVLDAATLWTDSIIGLGDGDAQAKLGTSLYLSKDLPFKLTIHVFPCQWDEDLPLLQPHANRIQEMVLWNSRQGNVANDIAGKFVDQFFSQLGPLPYLTTIGGNLGSQMNWDCIFSHCPGLVFINDIYLPPSVIKSRPRLLRPCRMLATSSDIISCFEDLTCLEGLAWLGPCNDNNPISNITLPYLPNLRDLRGFLVSNASFINMMKSAGNLRYLSFRVEVNWQLLCDVFCLISCLPHLRSVHLTILEVPGKLVWPAIESTGTNVAELTISNSGTLGRSKGALDSQETLFSILSLYFPKITRFDLSSTVYTAGVAAYIRSAEFLLSLNLSGMKQPDYEVSLESSSLEVLTIDGDQLLEGLANFTCPLLSDLSLVLYIPGADVYYWNRHHSTYGHIHRLKIRTSQSLWEIHVLKCSISQSLGEIHELRALQHLQLEDAYTIRGFLLSLIFNPGACPILSKLELSEIPEWDLLFIMLERRNYIPSSQGISRIKTIVLSSPIPPVLLAPLAELLGGRFTERPSNWDLSFSSIIGVYFEWSIPGCMTCLELLSSCSTSTIIVDYPYMRSQIQVELAGSDSSLPIGVWEWLKRRQERVDEWNRRVDEWKRDDRQPRAPSRVYMCPKTNLLQGPFIVTAHSFTGQWQLAVSSRMMTEKALFQDYSTRPEVPLGMNPELKILIQRVLEGRLTNGHSDVVELAVFVQRADA